MLEDTYLGVRKTAPNSKINAEAISFSFNSLKCGLLNVINIANGNIKINPEKMWDLFFIKKRLSAGNNMTYTLTMAM